MLKPLSILLLSLVAAQAHGQGADFGGPAPTDDDLATQEGLESATPTDNVNELGGNSAGGNGAPVEDFPAGENSGDFDIGEGGQGEGGNGLFDDAPADLGNDKGNKPANNLNSAFGNGAPPKNNAVPANNAPPANPVPVNNLPVNNAPPANPVPVNNVPANAQNLLNQISNTPPANATNPAPAPTASTDATGAEALTTKPAVPDIKAPPLPPPNDFSGAPPVPGTMRLMADGEAPEEYKVEPGDTLFDICDQMLDEAAYWPKLWALNPEIKNPHFIFPNMRLKFYPGDDETPPYLQVVSEDDVIPIDKGDLDEQELIAEKVIFPAEEALDEQVTEVIGPSQVDALTDQILTSGKIYDGNEIVVQVPGFIYTNEKDPLAYVISGRDGEASSAESHKVIVEAASGVSVGALLTVLRPADKVYAPDSGDEVGYRYYFVANVKIDKALQDGLYSGSVQNTRLGVEANDILVPFISTNRTVPMGTGVGQLASATANVVAFDYASQELGGAGHFLFLDKGNGDGVQPGMYLSVFGTPGYLTSNFGSADLPTDYEYVGVIRIIDSTDAGSVGYIVRNQREIRIGDRTNPKG